MKYVGHVPLFVVFRLNGFSAAIMCETALAETSLNSVEGYHHHISAFQVKGLCAS